MSCYHNITKVEFENTVVKQWGFHPMSIDGTTELVYGKTTTIHGHTVSCRIYSGINPDGNSREVGKDAIRIQLFVKQNGHPQKLNKTRRCLRVKGWKNNLTNALREEKAKVTQCKCGALLAHRKKGDFYGCVTYHDTGCKGTPAKYT